MSNVNLDGLPPEMQARISQIIDGAKQKAVAPQPQAQQQQQQTAAVVKQPSLMDHTIALRQEVQALRTELHAVAQVTDAVGQAVGQLYQMFCQQTEVTDNSAAYQAYEAPGTPASMNGDDY